MLNLDQVRLRAKELREKWGFGPSWETHIKLAGAGKIKAIAFVTGDVALSEVHYPLGSGEEPFWLENTYNHSADTPKELLHLMAKSAREAQQELTSKVLAIRAICDLRIED